jgi:hypothetical protein
VYSERFVCYKKVMKIGRCQEVDGMLGRGAP